MLAPEKTGLEYYSKRVRGQWWCLQFNMQTVPNRWTWHSKIMSANGGSYPIFIVWQAPWMSWWRSCSANHSCHLLSTEAIGMHTSDRRALVIRFVHRQSCVVYCWSLPVLSFVCGRYPGLWLVPTFWCQCAPSQHVALHRRRREVDE